MDQREGYTTRELAVMLEVPMHQINRWVQQSLLSPSIQRPNCQGTKRLFSFQDLVHAVTVKRLKKSLWKPKQIQTALATLEVFIQHPERLTKHTLIHDGNALLILYRSDRGEPMLIDAARPDQTVLSIALEVLMDEARRCTMLTIATDEPKNTRDNQ